MPLAVGSTHATGRQGRHRSSRPSICGRVAWSNGVRASNARTSNSTAPHPDPAFDALGDFRSVFRNRGNWCGVDRGSGPGVVSDHPQTVLDASGLALRAGLDSALRANGSVRLAGLLPGLYPGSEMGARPVPRAARPERRLVGTLLRPAKLRNRLRRDPRSLDRDRCNDLLIRSCIPCCCSPARAVSDLGHLRYGTERRDLVDEFLKTHPAPYLAVTQHTGIPVSKSASTQQEL